MWLIPTVFCPRRMPVLFTQPHGALAVQELEAALTEPVASSAAHRDRIEWLEWGVAAHTVFPQFFGSVMKPILCKPACCAAAMACATRS